MPARNSETSIAAALDSIMAQDYGGPMEVIVADGSNSPATSKLVRRHYPYVRLVPNPYRTASNGLNAAVKASTGQIIVRCDAHAVLPPDYVRLAVQTMTRTGAAVVGGRQIPICSTPFERAVGMAISTPMGAGDARYRLSRSEGPVDTVYLGVFRRGAFEAVGGFDPCLVKSQDSDLNWRLRKGGDTIWLNPAISVFYRPRGAISALAHQYFEYGRWKPVVLRRNPSNLKARHLAPPLLVLGLVASVILGVFLTPAAAALLPLLYAAAALLGALAIGLRRRDPAALLLPLVLVTMHLSWGVGFLIPARPAIPPPT